jgi:acyl-CoA thioesterase
VAAEYRPGSLYHRLDERRFRSTELTAGPWSGDAQHGGPVAALMVHRFNEITTNPPMHLARMTMELHGPVPVDELIVDVDVMRPGRRIQLLSASLRAGDRVVASARAWQIEYVPATPRSPDMPPAPWLPDHAPRSIPPAVLGPGFHRDSVEWRFTRGDFLEPGASFGWVRLHDNVVDDIAPTPTERAAVAADFGNGFSSYLDPAEYVFINTDLTVHFVAEPSGEWIGLDARTLASDNGAGVAVGTLYDVDGAVGHAAQTLMIQAR